MPEQLSMRLENDAPALIVRANASLDNLRSVRDWHRDGAGWTSANGWTVTQRHVGRERDGWVVDSPDGYPEWWAHDPVTAMERAEGMA